jgi:hypothetical protein
MGTKIIPPEVSLNTHKVAYSKYAITSKMFYEDNMDTSETKREYLK